MFIRERIKLHRTIQTALAASKKVKTETPSSVQEAFKALRQLDRNLRAFNQKHPLFSKLVWLIDRLFAFYPMKKEMIRLKALIPKVVHAVPFTSIHTYPLDLELMDLLQSHLFLQKGEVKNQILIDQLHFLMQSMRALKLASTAIQTVKDLKMMPDTPASHNTVVALSNFQSALIPLLLAVKNVEQGKVAKLGSTLAFKQALKSWEQLKLPLFALKIILEQHPRKNPFDPVVNAICQVENSLDPQIISARRFLEERIRQLHDLYRSEKLRLKNAYPYYPEMVLLIVQKQLRSYKKLIRLHAQAHIALNYSRAIADLPICKKNPDDRIKDHEYREFIRKCLEGKVASANLFLPAAAETVSRIKEYGRASLRCRKEIHQALEEAGVQARLRLHTKIT